MNRTVIGAAIALIAWGGLAWAEDVLVVGNAGSASNMVVVGEDGQSALITQSDNEIPIFQREVDMPYTGGFFKRDEIWADRQDIRITSLNSKGLVFLGNERIDAFDLTRGAPGDELFRYTEMGHTLHVRNIGTLPPAPTADAPQNGVRLEVRITRP